MVHTIKLRDDYIKLGQALKAAGLVENGVDAKYAIQDGLVLVNGNTELQRGKKLYSGDIVSFEGETIMISIWSYSLSSLSTGEKNDYQITGIGKF